MKRNFFNPAHARFLDAETGRTYTNSRSLRFGSACFKTDATPSADEEEAKEDLLKEIQKRTMKVMDERGWKKETIDSFAEMQTSWKTLPLEAIRALADEKTGVMAKIIKIDAAIEGLENAGKNGDKSLSLRSQIMAWQNKLGIETPEKFETFKRDSTTKFPTLEIRVASPMTPANTLNSSAYLPKIDFDYTVNDIPRLELTFWDVLPKGKSSSAVYGWVNKTNPLGAAAFIGPGVAKPGVSFELETFISSPKKVAATDKVATELLQDIDGMETLIKDEIRYQILLKVNTELMSGVGSSTNPTGIQNLSVAFTATGLETTNPTIVDALRAVVAQMRSGVLKGAITIFINPIDSANMDMTKATDSGVYMLPPFVTASGRTISGATIIEDANIPVGYFQAAMLQYYKVLIYKPLVVDFGYEMDDFTKNLVTYRGEMRIHQFFNEIYTGAFVYDTYNNVQAAIAI